jgi:hypothetical protein
MVEMLRSLFCLFSVLLCLPTTFLYADGPAFDLAGPKIDVHVKRGTVTLPISEAPNLLPGDRLWVHPDLPASQSEHFVLVVAFLRGSTNPPPPEWFTRVETWTRAAHDEGVFVNVPAGAQQALLFLAPETGGDFKTLRKAVRQEPGSFVRAAQDLQAASWERLRLDAYLNDVKMTSRTDAKKLEASARLAARSLGIKINESCFSRPSDQQASCLSHNSEGMVLDDSNAQSLASQLANGSALDLVNQLSFSTQFGGGMYSPYVGAVVDTIKILGSLHTAHFQYIPALALPATDSLNLRLNMPPSFRNPKSVVVVALPPIGPARAEPLYSVSPAESFCALKPGLALPAEGAPLVFATPFAHNLYLRVQPDRAAKASEGLSLSGAISQGPTVEVPVQPDADEGGLLLQSPVPALPSGPLTAELHGKWGFDDWEGPIFHLYAPEPGKWAVAPADQSALVVGRDDSFELVGGNSVCVQRVEVQTASSSPVSLPWIAPNSGTLQVKVPLQNAQPGPVNVQVFQFGLKKPDQLSITAYDAAASLDGLTLNAGDSEALLKGTRLDEVARATLHGIVLKPATLTHVEDLDQLTMNAGTGTAGLRPGMSYTAEVFLKDGRRLKAQVTVNPPRPQFMLLSKGVQALNADAPSPVQFGSPNDLPVNGKLVFFLKSSTPGNFPRNEKVELAAADSSFHTTLGLSDGSLMLEDAKTAMATVQPLARFGSSAFGPVRVRPVSANGQAGDWLPLGILVRLPDFKELRCPRSVSKPCVLSGTNLFLAASIAATPQFDAPTEVPPEFMRTDLIVPHPVNGTLYVKLRDDPETVQTLTLPVNTISPAEAKSTPPATQLAPAPPAAAPPSSGTLPGDGNPPSSAAPATPAPAQPGSSAPDSGAPAPPPPSGSSPTPQAAPASPSNTAPAAPPDSALKLGPTAPPANLEPGPQPPSQASREPEADSAPAAASAPK